jgi:hypothetical protein
VTGRGCVVFWRIRREEKEKGKEARKSSIYADTE